jgi:lipopolysaccharide export LptBFGC system permease protein LptF
LAKRPIIAGVRGFGITLLVLGTAYAVFSVLYFFAAVSYGPNWIAPVLIVPPVILLACGQWLLRRER